MSEFNADEKRGFQLLQQAEQALNRFSWFGLAQDSKYSDALECYKKAANTFKMTQNFQLAAETFEKIADLEMKANSNSFESSSNFILAGDMYTKTDAKKAVECYSNGIKMLIDEGRFGMAAKHSETIAEVFEKADDLEDAVKYYNQAYNFFNSDKSPSRANKNLEKIGELQATRSNFKEAFDAFDTLGKACLESNLLKFNAKKHFFHGLLCLLRRNDLVAVENVITDYKSLDYSFEESRECKLLEALVDAVKNLDVDKFADVLYSYDSVSKLTPWETNLFLQVKNQMQESAEEVPDLC